MTKRPSWDEYFMKMAFAVAERATCNRAQVGVVIVMEKRVVATGYCGSPPGMPHCTEVGCMIHEVTDPDGKKEIHCLRTTHAEVNAVIQAARYGIAIEGAVMYATHSPCLHCLKVLAGAGIKEVFFQNSYGQSPFCEEIISASGIKMTRVPLSEGE